MIRNSMLAVSLVALFTGSALAAPSMHHTSKARVLAEASAPAADTAAPAGDKAAKKSKKAAKKDKGAKTEPKAEGAKEIKVQAPPTAAK